MCCPDSTLARPGPQVYHATVPHAVRFGSLGTYLAGKVANSLGIEGEWRTQTPSIGLRHPSNVPESEAWSGSRTVTDRNVRGCHSEACWFRLRIVLLKYC